ncbi:MAG: hypothetical protein MUP11_00135 [Anaerolineales bacterium]|nr:hypothetical protein [Anaerolineales bacterium]
MMPIPSQSRGFAKLIRFMAYYAIHIENGFVRRVAWHLLDHLWEIEDRLVLSV